MQVIEKKVECMVKHYVAVDGEEFASEIECLRHESEIDEINNYRKQEEFIKKYGIEKLKDRFPINYESVMSDCNTYTWLRIPDDDVLKELNSFRDDDVVCTTPTIICIESDDEFKPLKGEYLYTLKNMVDTTTDFFQALGYKVTVEKEKEI